jgi:hypothetical protein
MHDIKQLLQKFIDFFGFKLPELDLPADKEDELIENLANLVMKYDLELPVQLFGWGMVPMSTIISQTTLLPMAPFLELIGIKGYEYVALFKKKENTRRLLERIDVLRKGYEW